MPSAPTTSFSAGTVTISWTPPDNGGSPIILYSVTIQKSDGTYLATATYCDGSSQAIVNAAKCEVPAVAINGSPYLKSWGSSIYAKVAASNIYGISSFSAAGNGAVILTVPDAPTSV